jgi:hypothetical protein
MSYEITVVENNTIVEISTSKNLPVTPNMVGSDIAPLLIDPAISIPFSGNALDNNFYLRVAAPSVMTALLQVAPPTFPGQRLTIFTFDDVNTLRLKAGNGFSYNGLSMNGDWLGALGSSISFVASKANIWREVARI